MAGVAIDNLDDRQKRLLLALVKMVRQYLEHYDDGLVETLSMSAGEHAIAVLEEYGLMTVERPGQRFGRWTEAGETFWEQN